MADAQGTSDLLQGATPGALGKVCVHIHYALHNTVTLLAD